MTEQNELLEAALKLAETFKSIENKADWSMETQQALDAIEKHRPKPEPEECYMIIWADGSRTATTTKPDDKVGSGKIRVAHLREVTPAPEWERWRNEGRTALMDGGYRGWTMVDETAAFTLCELHNAEMARVTGTEGK
jgi:hypothetical protein